ncbi:MAG: nicotinate phosphoribosyltransferase, partial [Acidobacteriota bacterium]|nr:nicotinate phosphoribosyltransferase [Acidobacteriota bacterium]
VIDGRLRDVYKQPITDAGKTSKKGRLDLVLKNGEYETVRLEDVETISAENSQLRTVFENGAVLVDDSLDEIRKRTAEKFSQ